MNEIVKYDNYMNSLNFKGFTSTDFNFLMVLCSKLREKDVTEIVVSFEELRLKTGYKQTAINRFVSDLERMNKKLMEITCSLKTDSKIIMFILFTTFEIDIENQLLIVSINQKFRFILNDLLKNFTRFELDEFVGLESKYTKNLYRILKQYRSTGYYETDIKNFRKMMDIPDSYENRDITSKIIGNCLKELDGYFQNLRCNTKYAYKRGRPVTGYIFAFTPETIHRESNKTSETSKQALNSKKKLKYNDYPQRTYDYEALEKELLNRGNPAPLDDEFDLKKPW